MSTSTTRINVVVAGAALVLVCAACGSASSPRLTAGPNAKLVATARAHAAERTAGDLLDRIPLPPGAQPVPSPSGIYKQPPLTTPVLRQRFWKVVDEPRAKVSDFLRRHPVAGYRMTGGYVGELDFSQGRHVPHPMRYSLKLVQRPGRTFVRAEATVNWVYPRSTREVIPAGVREIDISAKSVHRTVTHAADVQRIIHWFDALGVEQPEFFTPSCPGPTGGVWGPIYPGDFTFTFRGANGTPVAGAVVPSLPGTDSCHGFVSFTIRGKAQPPLVDDAYPSRNTFIYRVERLIGYCYPPASPACH